MAAVEVEGSLTNCCCKGCTARAYVAKEHFCQLHALLPEDVTVFCHFNNVRLWKSFCLYEYLLYCIVYTVKALHRKFSIVTDSAVVKKAIS